jgi:hypothetical protein
MNPIFLPLHDAQEIGLPRENVENLRRRVTVQRDAFSGRQALLANGKGVATVFAFNLPGYVRADYFETFALSGANFTYTFRRRDVL